MATKSGVASTWKAVSDRNAKVESGVPKHGAGHVERSNKMNEQVMKGAAARMAENRANKPLNPSGNTLPALSNAPKLALPRSLKKQA